MDLKDFGRLFAFALQDDNCDLLFGPGVLRKHVLAAPQARRHAMRHPIKAVIGEQIVTRAQTHRRSPRNKMARAK
jgi:hypothetical protein